jgi:Mg-chelatase subunit ChlI
MLTTDLGVDGHRADLVILKAARANAAYEGRRAINDLDIAIAAELALPHRVKQNFTKSKDLSAGSLEEKIAEMETEDELKGKPQPNSNNEEGTEAEKKDKKKVGITTK